MLTRSPYTLPSVLVLKHKGQGHLFPYFIALIERSIDKLYGLCNFLSRSKFTEMLASVIDLTSHSILGDIYAKLGSSVVLKI